jgi:hypothetical protein
MSTKGYIPPQLGGADLRKLLLEALNDTPDNNPETFHARFDHPERGLSLDDVIHGLERPWAFSLPPKFNQVEWQWKYSITTESIEGEPIVMIVAVDTANRRFEVITRWK